MQTGDESVNEGAYGLSLAGRAYWQRVEEVMGEAATAFPTLGWIVNGDSWHLMTTYVENTETQEIRILGPYPSGFTMTYMGIFKLLEVIRWVTEWGAYIVARGSRCSRAATLHDERVRS